MDKAPDAFRTISEVAEDLDLPQHVLRFWETRFPQIKPLKRGGGRRYYRPDDVFLLRGIRYLLYGEGYTIKGVQRIIREQGIRHIMTLWQESQQEENSQQPLPVGHQAFAPPTVRGAPVQWDPSSEEEEDFSAADNVQFEDEEEESDYTGSPAASMVMERQRSTTSPPSPAAAALPTPLEKLASQAASLNSDDNRRLQATLYELMECKRILEGAR